jgi:uroporphyrinogen decarboxylase
MNMDARQRFTAVCEHQHPDHYPIDYIAKRDADQMLKRHFGVSAERELLDVLGCDLYHLSARDISQNEAFLPIYRGPRLAASDTQRTCPFGIRYQRAAYDWKLGADEALEGPLEKAESAQDVLKHPWPEPRWFDVEALIPECEENARRVIVAGFWTAIFGNAYRMHGFENFLMNMALKPELIKTLIDRLTEFYLELNERLFSALEGRIDIYYFGNDFGSQNGLLFSRDMWREFFLEDYRRLIGLAHDHRLKVMVHSCGSIRGILGDLIEAGVDIIDPVQTTADDMEPIRLKQDFGDRIVFHGAVDTQGVLPNASVEGVERHVREILRTLGRDGGYIFAPCNAIQADTPPENVEAMYRVAAEYRPGIDR